MSLRHYNKVCTFALVEKNPDYFEHGEAVQVDVRLTLG